MLPSICDADVEELVDILNLFQTNSFSILGELMQSIGHAVFPSAALMNHSCKPNCALLHLLQPGCLPKQHFIALEDIPAGTELTHCYVEQLMPRNLRQDFLKKHYGFTCDCRRCLSPPQVDLNYERFSPKLLDGKSIQDIEAILRETPHWTLRAAQYQRFLQLMLNKNSSAAIVEQQIDALRNVIDYDRLLYSEHHPLFVLNCKILEFLQDSLKELSQ